MGTMILLIRHGETAFNREKTFRGMCDVPLNDNGRAQARLLGNALRDRSIDAAYSSPLSRVRQTAEIALEGRGIEITIDKGLLDFSYGEWNGLKEDVVAKRWPGEYERWLAQPHTIRVPGGDTLQEVFDRTSAAMETICSRHEGQTVILFSHRVVTKLLLLYVLGLPLERFGLIRQDNCCINEFERTLAGYVIHTLNDASHIRCGQADLLKADF